MTAAIAAMPQVLHGLGRILGEAGSMFWETLWALVLGFTLSGVVQAFVARETMQRKLGNHGARATIRASLYGMASSSCSYAASAMSKSLFLKGADFVAAMVFMAASFSLRLSREGGVAKVILFSAACGFGVYFFSDLTRVLGQSGAVPVLLAATAPAIAAILIGMTLLFNQEDG